MQKKKNCLKVQTIYILKWKQNVCMQAQNFSEVLMQLFSFCGSIPKLFITARKAPTGQQL